MERKRENKVRCLNCNTELISHYRHDFQMCKCENRTFVDGGSDYQRFGGKNLAKIEVWNNEKQCWEKCK